MRLKHLGAMSLLAFTVTACTTVMAAEPPPTSDPPPAAEPDPTTVTTTSVEVVREPSTVYCLDGTEHRPALLQISTWSDGTTRTDTLEPGTCTPWPTRCQNGDWFIPPTALAGYQAQCLAYGRPLFRWWVLLEFGGEAHIAYRVIECESHWYQHARGPLVRGKRALGLMQLLGWGGEELMEPRTNIRKGKWVRDHQGWDAWSCF